MFLAQATAKHKPPSSCVVHYQNSDTRAKKATKGDMYELQNEKELSVAIWFEKTLSSTAEKDERQPYGYHCINQYQVIYAMILPLGITAGWTWILPTIELNSLPQRILCIADCGVWTVTNNSPCQLRLNRNKTGIASDPI